ncbi:MAG TPA: hypothetical protein VFU15_08695 [Bacteroidia bacterium]|nr:hypothetical protein [Bacteroidia bacterium]
MIRLLSIASFVFLFSTIRAGDENGTGCAPRKGSCDVCDSLHALYHLEAICFALDEVSDSTSPWHDSLFVPQALIDKFEHALPVLYNNLPADSVPRVQPVYLSSFYRFVFIVDAHKYKKWVSDTVASHDPAIDALLEKAHLHRQGSETYTTKNSSQMEYTGDRLINPGALQRKFIEAGRENILVTTNAGSLYMPWHSGGYTRMRTRGNDVVADIVLPTGPGLPPELPFPVGKWTYDIDPAACTLKLVSVENPYRGK